MEFTIREESSVPGCCTMNCQSSRQYRGRTDSAGEDSWLVLVVRKRKLPGLFGLTLTERDRHSPSGTDPGRNVRYLD